MLRKKRFLWQYFPYYLAVIILSLLFLGWYNSYSLKKIYLSRIASDLESRSMLKRRHIFNVDYTSHKMKIKKAIEKMLDADQINEISNKSYKLIGKLEMIAEVAECRKAAECAMLLVDSLLGKEPEIPMHLKRYLTA